MSIEDVSCWPRGLILLRKTMAESSFRQLLFTGITRDLSHNSRILQQSLFPDTNPTTRHDILHRISSLAYKIRVLAQNRSRFALPELTVSPNI